MEGIAHYDDPTAGWPDPEHTTLQQAVAALAAAAAAQDQHGLHHHHHPFGDLGDSSNGADVSRAPGNVAQHDHHNGHDNITLAGAAAAAGGMHMPLSALDLSTHSQLPPFPHHLGNAGFSMSGSHMQMQMPMQLHLPMQPSSDILAEEQAAAAAKKAEKKERKKREKEEAKRQKAEAERQTVTNSQPTVPQSTQLQTIRPEEATTPNHIVSNSTAGPSRIPAIPAPPKRARPVASNNDPTDAIVRRPGNGDDDGPITNVNEWLAGSWLKGPALRKVAKEKGKFYYIDVMFASSNAYLIDSTGVDLAVHLRKGKFTSQEEKLVDDAITDYLGARGLTREHDLTRMLFGGDGDLLLGDGDAGGNDGAGGTQGSKTRAKNKDRVDLVKAIGESSELCGPCAS